MIGIVVGILEIWTRKMSVTRDEVQHIALLARLELTGEEVERYSEQLTAILDYSAKLNELDTSAVAPLFHAVPVENVFREDIPGNPLGVERSLQNTARRKEVFFEVPKVADGS